MKFTIVDAMRAAGYEALPGGAECIRKAEFLESRNETPIAPDDSTRKGQMSVQPAWCRALPIQQQSVLLLGARGPDGIAKAHPAKRIQRAYRACVLVAAKYGRCLKYGEKGDTFMCLKEFANDVVWDAAIKEFFETADDLPHHFYMHLIHGAEILGYKHPDRQFRERWHYFYRKCVKDFHLNYETEQEMDARLSDWSRRHWCHDAREASEAVEHGPPTQFPKSSLSVILDEIEERMKAAQEKEYDSVWKFRKAVGMSADDVPALVKALRRAISDARSLISIPSLTDRIELADKSKAAVIAILTQREP